MELGAKALGEGCQRVPVGGDDRIFGRILPGPGQLIAVHHDG
jgi:hypothetical protein